MIPRYVIFVSFPFHLLTAYTLTKFKKNQLIVLLVMILLVSSIFITLQYLEKDKEDWKKVSDIVDNIPKEYTNIIIERGYNAKPFSYYWDKECFASSEIYNCLASKNVFTVWGDVDENRYTEETPYIIYIVRYLGGEMNLNSINT